MRYYCYDCVHKLDIDINEAMRDVQFNYCDHCGCHHTLYKVPDVLNKDEAIQYLLDAELIRETDWVQAAMWQNVRYIHVSFQEDDVITMGELDEWIEESENDG